MYKYRKTKIKIYIFLFSIHFSHKPSGNVWNGGNGESAATESGTEKVSRCWRRHTQRRDTEKNVFTIKGRKSLAVKIYTCHTILVYFVFPAPLSSAAAPDWHWADSLTMRRGRYTNGLLAGCIVRCSLGPMMTSLSRTRATLSWENGKANFHVEMCVTLTWMFTLWIRNKSSRIGSGVDWEDSSSIQFQHTRDTVWE